MTVKFRYYPRRLLEYSPYRTKKKAALDSTEGILVTISRSFGFKHVFSLLTDNTGILTVELTNPGNGSWFKLIQEYIVECKMEEISCFKASASQKTW